MKRFTLGFLALATALAIAPAALAESYASGNISVDGYDNTWSATEVVLPQASALAGEAHGSLATVFPAAVSPSTTAATMDMSSLTFSTVFTSADGLFVTVGPNPSPTATFTIVGPIDVEIDSPTEIEFSGLGILAMTGYLNTPANFSFTSTDSGPDYGSDGVGFTLSITADPTPEPSSLLLLGTGLLGLAGFAFRRAKSILN
jgi:hypothetical protein